jgi:enterobacteria phage integrase
MAALGHTTLAQAELYTKEANRRRGGQRAVTQLNDHKANILSQTASERSGSSAFPPISDFWIRQIS